MKTKTFILTFYILFSHIAFGQSDSLSFEDKIRLTYRDCAHSHICCQVICPCCPNAEKIILNLKAPSDSLSHIAFGQDTLVVAKDTANIFSVLNGKYPEHKATVPPIYKNNYILNEQEKDSILNAVYASENTQKLLYRYGELKTLNVIQRVKNEEIFLYENHIHLVSILSSSTTPWETKQELLIGKIEYDLIRTTKDVTHHFCGTSSTSSSAKIIEIHSKDKAITTFIESINDEKLLNFSEMLMVFIRVKKNGKPIKKNEAKIQLDEKLTKIQQSKIQKAVLLPQTSATALYGSKGKHGVLLVYYTKK